jgi:hypothetical protein
MTNFHIYIYLNINASLACIKTIIALMMAAVIISETSVNLYKTKRCNSP